LNFGVLTPTDFGELGSTELAEVSRVVPGFKPPKNSKSFVLLCICTIFILLNCSFEVKMLHFRTSDNKEVDFVIEKPNGQLAAVEVKKRDTIEQSDFKGIQQLGSLQEKISSPD